MSTDVIFGVQLFSLITYVGSIFYIYRVLVGQKDATIETLKTNIGLLETQLKLKEAESPDILVDTLSKRIQASSDEMKRLSADKDKNELVIRQMEQEFKELQVKLEHVNDQMHEFREVAQEFFCPHCGEPMTAQDYCSETVEVGDREVDIDHEFISYACGLQLTDGEEISKCKNMSKNQPKPITDLF